MTEDRSLVPTRDWENVSPAEVMESVAIEGDLSRLSPAQRVAYYAKVCESMGLNPFTRPFDYLRLNGKLVLYAKRDATDQIRRNLRISVSGVEPAPAIEGLFGLIAHVRSTDGRTDTGTAYVSVAGLRGEAMANAIMKCETKAKRRATLSLAGLGLLDESEIGSIPDAETVDVGDDGVVVSPPAPTVSDTIAARVAAIQQQSAPGPVGETVSEQATAGEELTKSDDATDADYRDDAETEQETLVASVEAAPRAIPVTFEAFVTESVRFNRDELRAVAHSMFPDLTGFRQLTDQQRGDLLATLDEMHPRTVQEDPTDDDLLSEVMTVAASESRPAICGDVSPLSDNECDREPNHDGLHRHGPAESW